MRRSVLLIGLALAAIAVFGWLHRERLMLEYFAARTAPETIESRVSLLEPAMRFYPPITGAGPFPAVVQFHGCAGMRLPFQEDWARVANEAGYFAVIVDSLTPRGIDRETALKTVCTGKQLIGQERAGDVAAALEIIRKRNDIDQSRIVLAGWSHGAWSVMDYLALASVERAPAGLPNPPAPTNAIAGALLFYPYCGPGAWTRLVDWTTPALALISGKDSIVDPRACPPIFSRLAGRDERVTHHIYPETEHGFDDAYLVPEWRFLYDADAHADAVQRYRAFLLARRDARSDHAFDAE